MRSSHIEYDWALSLAIEKLRQGGEYPRSGDHQLATIAEAKAGNKVAAHWKSLPQEQKLQEMFAGRELRERKISSCRLARLMALLDPKKIPQPIVHLKSLTAEEWERLESRAQEESTKEKLRELKRRREALRDQIQALKKLGAKLKAHGRKRQKAA